MRSESNHTQNSMYGVRLYHTTARTVNTFTFRDENHFTSWYNGYGEYSNQRANYDIMQKDVDFPN